MLLDLLLAHFGALGVTAGNIVASPGNHDVPRGSPPSSAARYAEFNGVWRAAGCVVPWLDGIDTNPGKGVDSAYRLLDAHRRWVVYPVNTSNWCHAAATLPDPLGAEWEGIPALLSAGDVNKEETLRRQLDSLARYDMARVSGAQLEALRTIIEATPSPISGSQIRIAMMHHHLRAPSLREELKPFPDVSNLEQVRAFLRDRAIDVVVHGHKHEHAAQFEHIYDREGATHHRALVISGATFEAGRDADAARLITLEGLPGKPSIRLERIPLPRPGVDTPPLPPIERRLWTSASVPGAPIVIQGSDLDEVYERACVAASSEAAGGTLIVHLDLAQAQDGALPLPTDYPLPEPLAPDERNSWVTELVDWWQLDRSRLERRIPYLHGARLRRFGGKIDQVDRIIRLLGPGPTTRALAVLIDPFRDFASEGQREEFASFCLVEFKRREIGAGQHAVDAVAFYRAQEFIRWWPINVAELRHLQREICGALGFSVGRITTIAGDARTHSRSPTQVAMPIIDRWLDQSPQRLHLLANAFVQRSVREGAQRYAVRDWERTLSDLETAAKAYNPDGMPIAIEGLATLASYMEVSIDGDEHTTREVISRLKTLARANESYEATSRSKTDFDKWAPTALELVGTLRRYTREILGDQ